MNSSSQILGFKVTCPGKPGHGSRFIEDSAGPKLNSILQSVSQLREEQKALLDLDPQLTLGDVTSANITIVEGGVQVNVIPDKFVACKSKMVVVIHHKESQQDQNKK